MRFKLVPGRWGCKGRSQRSRQLGELGDALGNGHQAGIADIRLLEAGSEHLYHLAQNLIGSERVSSKVSLEAFLGDGGHLYIAITDDVGCTNRAVDDLHLADTLSAVEVTDVIGIFAAPLHHRHLARQDDVEAWRRTALNQDRLIGSEALGNHEAYEHGALSIV